MVFLYVNNGGDLISQQFWYRLCLEVQDVLERMAHTIEGSWSTESVSPFQSACWGFRPMPQEGVLQDLRAELVKLQERYGGAMHWCESVLDDIHGTRFSK
jgi:hypothetical protein